MADQGRNNGIAQQSWLEYMPVGGGPLLRKTLESERLTIGRCDSADLQIDSTRVSREHACLEASGESVILRDLNSTNGTFVNGELVQETQLHDGDVITVADADITFLTNATSRLRRMATQPLPPSLGRSRDQLNVGHSSPSNISAETEAIRALRTAHEKLLQGATPVSLDPVVDATTKRAFAHVACAHLSNASSDGPSRHTAPPSHVALRTLQMRRATAVQQIDATPDCSQLVLPFETWEVTECDKLLWHLEELHLSAPTDIRIAAAINANDAVDLNAAQHFCRGVKSARFGLALMEFVGGAAQIAGFAGIEPDFLFLAADLTNDLHNKPRLRRQLPAIVDACRQANISPVASNVTDQPTIDCLVEEGVRLFVNSIQAADRALDQSHARDAAFAASH